MTSNIQIDITDIFSKEFIEDIILKSNNKLKKKKLNLNTVKIVLSGEEEIEIPKNQLPINFKK